ncbi:hypothetical protein O9G_005110 [Rozella allomycis CSF55]|uniref:Uncharacterized protein n=1 Tax=Rozella allomycis (strain CSF55) TaxID=988480 RepID=A0A075AUH1_ROZAC|nr:hypothetical protein O9G_005110 [Rozella allomycis CSF55]|eukprot:EPZ32147.1 hypothetical protein O9G_005110 [Rozella allomycis CSF55]
MVFLRDNAPKTVREAFSLYESLVKRLMQITLKKNGRDEPGEIHKFVQNLVSNAGIYRELMKEDIVETDLQGQALTDREKQLVNSFIHETNKTWAILYYSSQYLESTPDTPYFHETTSKLTTSGYKHFKSVQEFLDHLVNLSQSLLSSVRKMPVVNENNVEDKNPSAAVLIIGLVGFNFAFLTAFEAVAKYIAYGCGHQKTKKAYEDVEIDYQSLLVVIG